uniref:hypothetical protein n=1 Tax=Dialister sp. TaxID=1955814 RepID=UPI003FEE357B
RLHKPFGQLPRWGAKNVLPFNLIALSHREAKTHNTCICVVRFYLAEMTIFLSPKTLYRQKEVKRGE